MAPFYSWMPLASKWNLEFHGVGAFSGLDDCRSSLNHLSLAKQPSTFGQLEQKVDGTNVDTLRANFKNHLQKKKNINAK